MEGNPAFVSDGREEVGGARRWHTGKPNLSRVHRNSGETVMG